jgi:Mg2+-importing ATPase
MEWKKFTTETTEEVVTALRSTQSGLNTSEAKRRLLEYGKNSVQARESFLWRVMKHRGTSILSWVFILAAIITSIFGNFIEAGCILLFLLLNAALELYQEFHSEKAARTLEHFLLPRTRVWRDGQRTEIASHLLVPGDIIELHAGETFPADVRFLNGEKIFVDETLIEGNRTRIEKNLERVLLTPFALAEARNMGFAGTTLLAGSIQAIVVATGHATALGEIAYESILNTKETPFEKNIRSFSRFLVKILLVGLIGTFGLYLLIHGEQAALSDMLIFTLVLAITVIPEAFPAITALALARGSLRLAKKNLVVKRLSAIEDLGSIEVLCLDKTGILTENVLTVTQIFGKTPTELWRYALLACHQAPVSQEAMKDAFDIALWRKADDRLLQEVRYVTRLQSLDFDSHTRLQAVLVQGAQENTLILRGAPEEILRRVEKLDSFTRKSLQNWIREAGGRGERVLAVATKTVASHRSELHIEGEFVFQGLITFLDPIKPNSKKTVRLAAKMGVALKIFTGDSKESAGAAAYATGITKNGQAVITGTEFEVLSLPEQLAALETFSVFARFSPTQKAIAVQLLQKTSAVGVVGTGIADKEMLRFASVAMLAEGAGGISREAADILLLQKDLQVVVEGIRESRAVFANILKYLKITLASNFGNFYSITLAALFLPYLPLLPLQILLLNFLTDIPMLAIATDRVDEEKLERPKDHSIHAIIVTATLFGVISSFFDLTLFKIFSEYNASTLQTVWFLFSILTEVLLLYSLRSRRWFFRAKHPSFLLLSLSVLATVVAIFIPHTVLGAFLGFTHLTLANWLTILAFTGSYFVVTEILKRWYYVHSALFTQSR